MMDFPGFEGLAGKRILVVGGSSGIGLAAAQSAADHGALVTLAGRDPDKATAAAASCGAGATGVAFEMTDEDAVAAFFAVTEPFDHVVVTAAQLRSGKVRDLPVETARATFDSKFWGSYLIARYARIADDGSIVLISGAAARRPRAGRAPVVAASAAVEALTKVLAAEFAPIRVNCVAPGLVDTPMLRAARDPASAPPPQPVARVADPMEIAFQILACLVNPFMTGTVVDIDGGLSLT